MSEHFWVVNVILSIDGEHILAVILQTVLPEKEEKIIIKTKTDKKHHIMRERHTVRERETERKTHNERERYREKDTQ